MNANGGQREELAAAHHAEAGEVCEFLMGGRLEKESLVMCGFSQRPKLNGPRCEPDLAGIV